MFKKIISTVMGFLAGLEFVIIVLCLKELFVPEMQFSNNPLVRFPLLIVFFSIIGVYRGYLIEKEDENFTKYQIRSMIAVIIILAITAFLFQSLF